MIVAVILSLSIWLFISELSVRISSLWSRSFFISLCVHGLRGMHLLHPRWSTNPCMRLWLTLFCVFCNFLHHSKHESISLFVVLDYPTFQSSTQHSIQPSLIKISSLSHFLLAFSSALIHSLLVLIGFFPNKTTTASVSYRHSFGFKHQSRHVFATIHPYLIILKLLLSTTTF